MSRPCRTPSPAALAAPGTHPADPTGPAGAMAARHPPARGGRHPGFALVEVMVALTLGLVIIAALGQLYSGARQSYVLSDALTRLNENGRFAADFLSRDIRMAGYLSCGGASARIGNSVNAPGNWIYDTGGLRGYEGGTDTPPSEFTGQVRAGTDLLIVRRASLDLERNVLLNDAQNGVLKLGLDHGFQVGEILVISNPACTQATLFQAARTLNLDHSEQSEQSDAIAYGSAQGLGPGNCTSALFGNYSCNNTGSAETGVFRPGSVVGRYAVHAYYVTATDPPTLVRKRLTQAGGQAVLVTEELIRDIEDFQVLYGIDTLADGVARVDSHVTANQVTDWPAVMSVRFALLARSRENRVRAAAASTTHDLLGHSVTPATDRRIRRTFNGLVAVRNHLP